MTPPLAARRNRLSLPLITPLASALARDETLIFYLLVIALTGLVLAMKTWGLVALAMTALALVPLAFGLLIVLSLG